MTTVAVAARDSKNPGGQLLVFARGGWTGFVRGIGTDEFGSCPGD
ncbi:DUF397 domain-containing protein [Streptomyces sp. NPDC056716]